MAQRTIHMLFAVLLSEKIAITDPNRFMLGNILPDSYKDPAARKTAHYIKSIPEGDQRFFDFPDFLDSFRQEILTDDLYLGYYAHLVEDAFYRYFLYCEKDLMDRISKPELDILYTDYHILNSYIAKKYDLPTDLTAPEAFGEEPLNRITEFDARGIICEYQNDLTEAVGGQTTFLTEDMLEEFVAEYIDLLADELRNVRLGSSLLNALDYKWQNKR